MNSALRKYLDDLARRDADRARAQEHGGGTAPRLAAPVRTETKRSSGSRRGAVVANHKCAPGGDVLRAEHAIFGSVEQFADDTIAFLNACRRSCVEAAVLRIIDSPGGYFDAAVRVSNAVHAARSAGMHVTTIVEERCLSAATLIPAASDCVVARPSATWMIHEGRLKGAADKARIRALRDANATMVRAHVTATGQTEGRITLDLIMGRTMTAVDARTRGYFAHVLDEGVFPWQGR